MADDDFVAPATLDDYNFRAVQNSDNNPLPIQPIYDPSTGTPLPTNDVPQFDVPPAISSLLGTEGKDRYQLWPEKLIRSAVSAPADAIAGNISPDQEIPRALDMAGLVMPGPLAEAPGVATLGSGMTRMATSGDEMAAPVFYSAVENAVNNSKIDTAPVSQWLGYLKNQPGVKQEELDWTLGGLPQDQKLTKPEMQSYVDANKVQLNEVNKGMTSFDDAISRANSTGDKEAAVLLERAKLMAATKNRGTDINNSTINILNGARQPTSRDPVPTGDDRKFLSFEALNRAKNYINASQDTKFSSYQLPGGENYREMLMTMPKQSLEQFKQKYTAKTGVDLADFTDAQIHKLRSNNAAAEAGGDYKSSHWDEPNVLAHVRMNDRNVEGNKTLHLEEIQSDWHQQGRQQGYKLSPQQEQQFKAIDDKITNSNDEGVMGDPDIKSAIEKAVTRKIISPEEGQTYLKNYRGVDNASVVPNAPFKQTWPDLVLKRMIRHAADRGMDAISWTPGEAQAARYDLSKQVKRVYLNNPVFGDNGFLRGHVAADDLGGNTILNKNVTAEELPGLIGKEAANKLINNPTRMEGTKNKPQTHVLEGNDLRVGGEGMKTFYDKMLVDKANSLAKKYGGKVEEKNLSSLNREHYVSEVNLPIRNRNDEFKTTYDVRFKNQNGDERFNVNYPTKEEAQKRADELNTKKGDPIHFLRLPQELKNTAQQKGFPLFSGGLMLNPVDGDPFQNSNNKKFKLVPIQGNPFQ